MWLAWFPQEPASLLDLEHSRCYVAWDKASCTKSAQEYLLSK